ncbi:hypothetical protein CBR58_31015 [Bacillus thuringiensis]|nr:hypothetical protein BK763_19290 [Bacillus thuringiensis serovar thompsoni]OTZ54214.1 hypothetical protein BK762_08505 [Bacillus thuringiensis serovar toumanoffi]PNK41456.1 hypothetical protein CBR58_31015 [Bacillus thuringiensis]
MVITIFSFLVDSSYILSDFRGSSFFNTFLNIGWLPRSTTIHALVSARANYSKEVSTVFIGSTNFNHNFKYSKVLPSLLTSIARN